MTRIAVIDVETTGLNPFRHDRIIELAALIIDLDGTVIREFETLINPQRDIGPTQIHGLASRDIINAPIFDEIIGDFLAMIDGCITLAGHNVRFDLSFLSAEFNRCGVQFPDVPTLCTMKLAGGGSLLRNCEYFGINPDGKPHTARYDAIASAQLLTLFLNDSDLAESELLKMPGIKWPSVPRLATNLITRRNAQNKTDKPPTFLQNLLRNAHPELSVSSNNESFMEYADLLNRVLEDRVIDAKEGEALIDLASKLELPINQIEQAHKEYLSQLAKAAWADGVVTDAENRDLLQVSELLGFDEQNFKILLKEAKQASSVPQTQTQSEQDGFLGKRVCFTGECQCVVNGERITRSKSYTLAEGHGMVAAKSVTKKLDFLVVADPLTQSGKAQKAKSYGVRIMQARVFWRALGLEVT